MRGADYEAFCSASWPRLVAGLTHQLGDLQLAEDSAQEALIRAGIHWGEVRVAASPLGWTFRVGANVGKSQLRRHAAERRALARFPVRDSADRLAEIEEADVLAQGLAALPAR
ncbi:MAG: hypothetical protein ACSLEW_10540 [Nocardioides sp.]